MLYLALALPTPLRGEPVEDASAAYKDVIEEYCTAVKDAAADRRAAVQTAALKDLEVRIEQRLALLEKRKTELESIIKRRDALRTLANQEMVEIYSGMEAAAAARHLEKLDLRLASSVVQQLKPRVASAVLGEMDSERAVKIMRMIAVDVPLTREQAP